jgi:hypothetical protein
MATRVTWDPENLHTVLVYATKSIVFTNPIMNEFSDLACDNGWLPLMVAMVGKSANPAPPPPPPILTHASSGGSDPLDVWASSAVELVSETTQLARQATTVLTNRQGAWSLLRNWLQVWDTATTTTANGLKAIRASIADVADEVDQP